MAKLCRTGSSSLGIGISLTMMLLAGCGGSLQPVAGPVQFEQTAHPSIERAQEVKFVRYLISVLDLKAPAQNGRGPVPSDNPLRTNVDAIALMLEIGAHKPDVIQDAADDYHRFDSKDDMDDTLRTLYCLFVNDGVDHLWPLSDKGGVLRLVGSWPFMRTGVWPNYFQDKRSDGLTWFTHEAVTGRLRDLLPYAKQRMTDDERGELWRRFVTADASGNGSTADAAAEARHGNLAAPKENGIVRLTPEFVKMKTDAYDKKYPGVVFTNPSRSRPPRRDSWRFVPLEEQNAWVSLERDQHGEGVAVFVAYSNPGEGFIYPATLRVRDGLSQRVIWSHGIITDKVRKADYSSEWQGLSFSSPASRPIVLELVYRGKTYSSELITIP